MIMRYSKLAAVVVPVESYEEAADLLASAADGPAPAQAGDELA